MQIQIIFSFLENHDQLAGNFPITDKDIATKEALIDFGNRLLVGYFGFLPKDWKMKINVLGGAAFNIPDELPTIPKLVKMSCMVSADVDMPEWYSEANGKIWWEDLYPLETRPF